MSSLIQTQGSDHCPVFADMKRKIHVDGEERFVQDVMNPLGMFSDGIRKREYSPVNDPLPMSGKLIPEFFGRRNIREMFTRKSSLQGSPSRSGENIDSVAITPNADHLTYDKDSERETKAMQMSPNAKPLNPNTSSVILGQKRSAAESSTSKNLKRSKSITTTPPAVGKGQQSLKGFFKPKSVTPMSATSGVDQHEPPQPSNSTNCLVPDLQVGAERSPIRSETQKEDAAVSRSVNSTPSNVSIGDALDGSYSRDASPSYASRNSVQDPDGVHDPIETKETWSKLFTKPLAPRCESHNEPCITLLTKKSGMNLGRSFWMCPRPLGPSGTKEKNTQWRCQTFIWCSDWSSTTAYSG